MTNEADEISPEQAAEMLGIALALVHQRMDSGKLPFRHIGEHRLIRAADVAELKQVEERRKAFAADLSADTEDLEANFSGMPAFSLENYELQRDADETDEEYAARRALFQTVG